MTGMRQVCTYACGSLATIAFSLLLSAHVSAQELIGGFKPDEALKLGERMYREGILPSGQPMQAVISEDVSVDGTTVTCTSCHLRSGFGSVEGTVYTPPTTGRKLFMEFDGIFEPVTQNDLMMLPYSFRGGARTVPYTEETLALGLRGGVDASGHLMKWAMPRYDLSDTEMAVLIHYLKSLSGAVSPGVAYGKILVATIVTDDVDPKDAATVIDAVQLAVKTYNRRPQYFHMLRRENLRRLRNSVASPPGEKDRRPRPFELLVWRLSGPPDGWPAQLDALYARQPVFALLGGISTHSWRPIHEFSESNGIPCLFPLTDLPVISNDDWYTLYLSKGLYQEGEAAARYLATLNDPAVTARPLQIYADTDEGHALADGFRETWAALGRPQPLAVPMAAGQQPDRLFWDILEKEHRPSVILFWHRPKDLSTMAFSGSGGTQVPLFLSYGLLQDDVLSLPEAVREIVYVSYPYEPDPGEKIASPSLALLKNSGISARSERLLEKAAVVNNILTSALLRFDRYFYRDYLIDMTSELQDVDRALPLYKRLSFGPGQRYASKGCYIVQLSSGKAPTFIKKSSWVIY